MSFIIATHMKKYEKADDRDWDKIHGTSIGVSSFSGSKSEEVVPPQMGCMVPPVKPEQQKVGTANSKQAAGFITEY